MSSYSELNIGGYSILDGRNGFYEDIAAQLFIKKDYVKIKDKESYDKKRSLHYLRTSVKICKERLEIYGNTFKKATEEFDALKKNIIRDNYYPNYYNFKKVTIENYLEEVNRIMSGESSIDYDDEDNWFASYLKQEDLRISCDQDIYMWLYLILTACDEDLLVEYDLSDIVNGGWIEEKDIKSLEPNKIILLTEGRTDSEFIKNGLKLFYPHLLDYYHFMDFDYLKYESNVSKLLHTIKSFIGAGIPNLIIAIFDNDAAATQELENLKGITLPENIKVIQYPEIELANKYPTIGPMGEQKLNINGLAGSIELYLGKDVLMKNKQFIPVQWIGYQNKIKKYQGVLQNKDEIQNKFREKVKNFKKNKFNEENWKELLTIIDKIKCVWI